MAVALDEIRRLKTSENWPVSVTRSFGHTTLYRWHPIATKHRLLEQRLLRDPKHCKRHLSTNLLALVKLWILYRVKPSNRATIKIYGLRLLLYVDWLQYDGERLSAIGICAKNTTGVFSTAWKFTALLFESSDSKWTQLSFNSQKIPMACETDVWSKFLN